MISPCGSLPDEVLIEMAVAGRSDCFSVLVDRHLTAVRRHVRAMVPNEPDQEDVMQEVLLKSLATSGGLSPGVQPANLDDQNRYQRDPAMAPSAHFSTGVTAAGRFRTHRFDAGLTGEALSAQ